MSANSAPSPPSPGIRWWPAVAIVVLDALYLAWVWLRQAQSRQVRVVATFPGLFFGVLFLLLWLLLFSRLPARLRLRLGGGLLVVAALFFSLFHIEGVSGNLVPIVSLRWGGARDFGGALDPAQAGVTAPGPDDYPQFHGPRRDGRLEGVRLARDWLARPPRELWRHDVGEGWSSFAVVGGAAVTLELRGSEETVVRYDLATGKSVWTYAYEAPFHTTVGGSGPRATPTIADGRVYSLGATGVLSCLDLDDGRLLWSRNVVEDNGGGVPDWGVACSPLVVGDLVVVQPGYAAKSLVAYRRATGEPVWQADGGGRGSYSSPYFTTLVGVPQIVMVNQVSVTGHDPETGRVLWKTDWPGNEAKVAMPLALDGDRVLVSAGYGVGSRLLRVMADGGAGLAVEELWESRRLKSKFANMVHHEGTVYGFDDGVLTALDPATGERRWKSGRYGHGQLILVDDLLLIQTEQGAVVLVEANPEERRELASLPALDSKTWNPPALSGRRLLVRNNHEAVCYELPVAP